MNQVLKSGPHVPNNQLYQTLGVPVAIWGRGGPKPVRVGTWPAGRRGAAELASPWEFELIESFHVFLATLDTE